MDREEGGQPGGVIEREEGGRSHSGTMEMLVVEPSAAMENADASRRSAAELR
jgi:hypothetical protein